MAISTVHDREADAVYVTLAHGAPVRTVEFDPGTVVDVDAAGNPIGIEILRPCREWPLAAISERFALNAATVDTLASIADGFRRPFHVSDAFRSIDMSRLVQAPC
ncbi:uncharacterized protein YuzE [Catenuloplanes nepalensis]|uniref:Uncharacterized protein YuzE n=1 Tax=Catenuloplanes nepalensis TaxID=587533 RepID=A0ABT9N1K6_9ACTN|nr:DUF2283 domain-containing protein [Catenuloplanes nepalensis]MDP9797569.1 uncharacterized protein YuzE [Catenuloplanes nepalensis]